MSFPPKKTTLFFPFEPKKHIIRVFFSLLNRIFAHKIINRHIKYYI